MEENPQKTTTLTPQKKPQTNQTKSPNLLCIMFFSLALWVSAQGLFPGKAFPQLLRIFLHCIKQGQPSSWKGASQILKKKSILQYQQINTLIFSKTIFYFLPFLFQLYWPACSGFFLPDQKSTEFSCSEV